MSSIDGTTPQTYEQELQDHYDPERSVFIKVSEKEAIRLMEFRMQDLRDLAHNDPTSGIIFKLIEEVRIALFEMEEGIRKKEEARKKQASKVKPVTKVKPPVKPKRPRKAPTKASVEEAFKEPVEVIQ